MGYFDQDGCFFFADRKKDIVRRGGENISSLEVESVIQTHPAVAAVAIVAKPDPVLGERLVAFIQPQEAIPPRPSTSFTPSARGNSPASRSPRTFSRSTRSLERARARSRNSVSGSTRLTHLTQLASPRQPTPEAPPPVDTAPCRQSSCPGRVHGAGAPWRFGRTSAQVPLAPCCGPRWRSEVRLGGPDSV